MGDDDEGLWLRVGDERVHILDTYAMTNLLLCSSVMLGTKQSRSTPEMRRNCLPHLRATMGILQPTLVISQGTTLSAPLQSQFELTAQHSPNLATCQLDGHSFMWANLYHPTRNWEWLSRPYFNDTVVPTLTEARTHVLTL